MTTKSANPAVEVELQRLIAEQSADDTAFVVPNGALSLDAPLQQDGEASLYEVLEERPLDVGPARKRSGRVAGEQVTEWRALRNKEFWTYAQIAEYAGVQVKTVRQHLTKPKHRRTGWPKVMLLERLDHLRESYEAGACLREIAEVHYEELGYKSWESCYQQLRVAFQENGIALRPKLTTKHGMRSASATQEDRERYWRQKNREATERRRADLVRCDALVKSGRPCRRFAVLGTRFCVHHNESTKRQPKWTKAKVLDALRVWAGEHSRAPKAKDWATATSDHPSFKTVTDLFGKWNFALYEAGLRDRKHPKPPNRRALLAKGYHECIQPGCSNLVASSRRYCRDRRCQDARSRCPVEPRHGTMVGFKVDGCCCGPCTEANAEYQRQYRRSKAAA